MSNFQNTNPLCHSREDGNLAGGSTASAKDYRFWVYIMANKNNRVLYIGMTNDLDKRVAQHKSGEIKGFTQRYKAHKLVYAEEYQHVNDAIAREKQLKKWEREWKLNLIETINPTWDDLTTGQSFPDASLYNPPCHSREGGNPA